jgi:GT2 family glycosyltransferase
MPLFSVIIPTCHRDEALTRCLEVFASENQEGMTLIYANSLNPKRENIDTYEVIVTDDGSLNTVERTLREKFPWAAWMSGPKRGPAANRNHGAAKALGEWLVFVDDDCVPERTFLASYARAAAVGNCAVLEGMTLPLGNRGAADMECPINELGGRLWSCNFAIKRPLFLKLGGFDENFPGPAAEDIDMQTRLSKAGHKAVFVWEARVRHPWRARRGVNFVRVQARSFAYYIQKHPEYSTYFSWSSLIKRAGGAIFREFPKNLVKYRCRGAVRMLTLDLVFVSYLFRYLTRSISFDN